MKRRTFLAAGGAALEAGQVRMQAASEVWRPPVDFRYAPRLQQAAFCFPDDPHKSLIGEKGDLRYGFDRRNRVSYFPRVLHFGLAGMDADPIIRQHLEAPEVPVVRTRIARTEAFLELTTFATNREGEGRVDNVIFEVRPTSRRRVYALPVLTLKTREKSVIRSSDGFATVHLDGETNPPFLIADRPLRQTDTGDGYTYSAPEGLSTAGRPLRCFFRLPQQGQHLTQLRAGMRDPDALLAEAREYWRNLRPFQGDVSFQLPDVYQNFLLACTRNILQARERVGGTLTFQVGPTTYRGLWVVDGHFILEAARYLGYDADVQQGLETTWGMQGADGGIFAGGGKEHWKDTGIAMLSMVRQAELSQDWSYFQKMQPKVLEGVKFLAAIREHAKTEGSANGRYGLLARGFGDGGIGGGVRDEFTNTIWVMAGLRAVAEAAERLGTAGYEPAQMLYRSLRDSFFACARQQMRVHPGGFEYLPMVLREDPQWSDGDERKRWRPQSGQWALAQTIFPGLLFEPSDPIVKGYFTLMQACTQEDVPIETGWLPHEGLWNYDAGFAAHALLWAGARDAALSIFTGFLNHATPLYCWREEQPLHGALLGSYVGDMPHNWASAECVLFLRHMLALEDGASLRLLAGLDGQGLAAGQPYQMDGSPSRFGRITIRLEPIDGMRGWLMKFRRGRGPRPGSVQLPERCSGAGDLRKPEARRPAERVVWC